MWGPSTPPAPAVHDAQRVPVPGPPTGPPHCRDVSTGHMWVSFLSHSVAYLQQLWQTHTPLLVFSLEVRQKGSLGAESPC